MNTELIGEQRGILAEKRENLRALYARFREMGHQMSQKGLVRWSEHGYHADWMNSRPFKERNAINALLKLQKNIIEQSMLLMELEHSLDCQDKKQGAKRDSQMHMGTCKICGGNFWESYEGARGDDLCDTCDKKENP